MSNTHIHKKLAAWLLCHLFVVGTLLVPHLAHGRPELGRTPIAATMDVWANGESVRYEFPRFGLDLGEGDLITGDIHYTDLGDYFSQADVEVVDDDTIVMALPEGPEVEVIRIGDSGWWGLWGMIEECDGDICGGYWGYLGTIVTDGFDLAEEFQYSLDRYGDGFAGGDSAPAIAVMVVAICVTVITVVSICAASDQEVSASAGPYTASLSC